MIPITSLIVKKMKWIEDHRLLLPRYHEPKKLISKENVRPKTIIRGKRLTRKIDTEAPVSGGHFVHTDELFSKWDMRKIFQPSRVNEGIVDEDDIYDGWWE